MNNRTRGHHQSGTVTALILLAILVVLIYSNSFHAAWHLDDYPNIIQDTHIHLNDLGIESVVKTFTSARTGKVNRPVSRLSFALNWYGGEREVFGYHAVNIAIHILTTGFLFLTVLHLLKAPAIGNRYAGSEHYIALLAAVLWAVNPIQTQAVTYIVQRMASMAALFYLAAIFLYVKARSEASPTLRALFYAGCGLCFLMGLGTKENAALLPAALVLIEFIFFQDLSQPKNRKIFLVLILSVMIIVVIVGSLLYLHGSLPSMFGSYGNRPFTLWERILTQPRVLVYYLSQIFYPIPSRLSIEHDVVVSSSLLNPWTTLPCIVIVASVITCGFMQAGKRPLLSFAVLFFFLNHAVESSVFGLELVFEHRNYLPSLFLFVPVSAGLFYLLNRFRRQNRTVYLAIVSFTVLLIVGYGLGTYIRNMTWATEESLWSDAVEKAPQSRRPLHNLALYRYEINGRYVEALHLYKKAANLAGHRVSAQALAYNNMASVYLKMNDYRQARKLFKQAHDLNPVNPTYTYRLARVSAKLGEWDQAIYYVDKVLAKHPHLYKGNGLKGIVLLGQEKPLEALKYFRKCMQIDSQNPQAFILVGLTLGSIGKLNQTELLFKHAFDLKLDNTKTLLRIVEINLKTGDRADEDRYMRLVFDSTDLNSISAKIKELAEEKSPLPFDADLLIDRISRKFYRRSGEQT